MQTQSQHSPAPADAPGRLYYTASLASVGLEMGIATAIGLGGGYWLDKTFGTEPWLLLLGTFTGIAAGFKGVFRAAREAQAASRASNPVAEE